MRTSSLRAGLMLCLAVSLHACGGDDSEAPADDPEPVAPIPAVVPSVADEASAAGYTLHEWGLVDVDLSTSHAEYAAGPGRAEVADGATATATGSDSTDNDRPTVRPTVDQAVDTANQILGLGEQVTGQQLPVRPTRPARRKPVLYFHLDDPATPVTFDLTVHLANDGRVIEHFPAGTVEGGTVSWTGVTLASDSCTGGPYPTADSPACQGIVDDYCEGAELSGYVASGAGCLTVGGQAQNFLFYRGDGSAPPLPLAFERGADGAVTVRNDSLTTPVGAILRLRRNGDEIRVAQVAIPAVGQSVAVGIPADAASDAHRGVLREQLTRIGLTAPEAQAFESAWFGEFFDAEALTPHAFPDALVFFLPADAVDGYARLEATPAPTATARAMAIRAGWPTLE